MNKNKLKTYAPKAREEFIKAVTERAHFYGISKDTVEACTIKGDFAFISGRPFPKKLADTHKNLIARIDKSSFTQVMEEVAYTWFNRIAAIRFMEINGYLVHGYRVLSHPDGQAEPEILEKAQFLDNLDGLEKEEILRLKMEADKDKELYQKLLVAQCNELSNAMPFLFEEVDDPTELLLPDNLLNTDSVIRQMVNEIPEEDWKEVEIIGWLYQFYISEKKNALMKAKKAYKTEDIPAVTQLFTPNWIVKYLVQNSVGAKWLATYPASGLKAKMEYYITPAEQTEDVKAKLKEITPTSLNPEELTVLDPASGSGHILVEAYNLLKDIYLERGYRAKDIPALILTKNLYGIEIDGRAAQLAGFALMMKARQDDREIFKKGIEPNIICLKSGNGADAHFKEAKELVELFENAKTFGSLIRVPEDLRKNLPDIAKVLEKKKKGDLFEQKDSEVVEVLLKQAEFLSKRYDCVIANPPYMGGKWMSAMLKEFVKNEYAGYEKDLFSAFIIRGREFAKENGNLGFMSPFVWMFISSYEDLRSNLINSATLTSLIQLEYSGFAEATVPICTFTFNNAYYIGCAGSFIKLSDFRGADQQAPKTLEAIRNKKCGWFYTAKPNDFKKIPGSPIAYWLKGLDLFHGEKVGDRFSSGGRNKTHNDAKYLRFFWEINIAADYWMPYSNGGEFRKYFGNIIDIVNWTDRDRKQYESHGGLCNPKFWGKEGITWSLITSAISSFRIKLSSCQYSSGSPTIFNKGYICDKKALAFLNSGISHYYLKALNPTLNTTVNDVLALPCIYENVDSTVEMRIEKLLSLSELDWNFREISMGFEKFPMLRYGNGGDIRSSYKDYKTFCEKTTVDVKAMEEENNRLLIEIYGLKDVLFPQVNIEEITLFANPKYRYKGELTNEELDARFKADTMRELISYAVGCMMGRYSLGAPGFVYAHAENKGFDSKKYKTFPPDDDGIIPITEREWFDDDAACRFFRFIEAAWDKKGLDENLDFVAEAIGRKSGESSREAIRRYFANDFFKDHTHTYKNRPIYWLFSSGKEKAFQALVYLHRYNEGTLARMRTEYVLPLQTKISRQIEHFEKDKDAASSGSATNKISKEIISLRKQAEELIKFDELLRNYADKKIKLDLDDGVKVNYGKFGELLADVKKIAAPDTDEQEGEVD